MSKKLIIIIILAVGILFRLVIVSDNNFIFNMDSARDMVDVREMVETGKLRLISHTSGIEGLFNTPWWYYLLIIPYVITGGSPYGSVLTMIFFWAVGGYFMMQLLSRYGKWPMIFSGSIWVASNFAVLATLYAYNPNPVLLLMPLFVYLLERFVVKNELVIGIALWFLAGMFYGFEIAFGVFIPIIIVISAGIFNKKALISRAFLSGVGVYLLTILPQLIFELRHNFFMTKSLTNYLSNSTSSTPLPLHMQKTTDLYLNVVSGTFMNWEILSRVFVVIAIISAAASLLNKVFKEDKLLKITILTLSVPFIGHLFLPMNVAHWHTGGIVAPSIMFMGIVVGKIARVNKIWKAFMILTTISAIAYSFNHLELDKNLSNRRFSDDPAVLRNEIAAVDYVYQKADGKNFKVYIYLPSVIDYPYQYIFPWYGVNKYGYLPKDYAYSPNKPEYISSKEKLNKGKTVEDSNLIFLIKQPDTTGIRHLWENTFTKYPLLETNTVGPLVIETRTEINNN